MSHRIGNVTVIQEEPDDICQECGKKDELRPYGKNYARVCYDCAMKDKITTTINMHRKLFGDILTKEQAQQYIDFGEKKAKLGLNKMPIDQIIKAVHDDHHKTNLDPTRWSEIEINPGGVYLHIGHVRPDGIHERTLITRSYYMDGNLVKFNVLGDGL